MSSIQTPGPGGLPNNPTPTLGHVPGLTAGSFAQPTGPTPPQTPIGGTGLHSATSSVSGSVLGKRDTGAISESEKEDGDGATSQKDPSSSATAKASNSTATTSGTDQQQPAQKKRRIAPTLVSGGGDGDTGSAMGESS